VVQENPEEAEGSMMTMNLVQQNPSFFCGFPEGYASRVHSVAIFRLPKGFEGGTKRSVGESSSRVAPVVDDRRGLGARCNKHEPVIAGGYPYRRCPGNSISTTHKLQFIASCFISQEAAS
jgi:hypothetical protein